MTAELTPNYVTGIPRNNRLLVDGEVTCVGCGGIKNRAGCGVTGILLIGEQFPCLVVAVHSKGSLNHVTGTFISEYVA